MMPSAAWVDHGVMHRQFAPLLALAITFGCLAGFCVAMDELGLGCRAQTSNRELRKAPELVEDRTLIGLTREEVVDRLGKPNDKMRFNGWDMVYWLSPDDEFFCVDNTWLVVRLGEDGRVDRAAITND
jgi:hypothetical protein